MGDRYHTQNISNIMDYNVIIVYDVDNILVHNGSFDASRNITSCIIATGSYNVITTGSYNVITTIIWCSKSNFIKCKTY